MYGNVQHKYMSTITIPNPQNKKIVQSNNSDVLGGIYISKNIDLQENVGRIRLGKRMIVNSADTDSGLSDLYNAVAFVSFNNNIYTLGSAGTSGKVYKSGTTSLQANFAADASSNAPAEIDSQYSDMVFGSNGNLYCTGKTKLYECAGGTWNATTRTITTGGPHMLAIFQNRVYVSNVGNVILSSSIATSTFGALNAVGDDYSLQLSIDTDSTIITFIRASASKLWIGTVNTKGGKGYIYSWDGTSTNAMASYRLEASGALSCVIKDEVPYVIDANGDLIAFNGGTFTKLAGLNRENGYRLVNSTGSSNTRFIHPNGMSVIQGDIHILINNLNDNYLATVEDAIQSGVYIYTTQNGLVHKYGLGLSTSAGTITDYGQTRVVRVGAIAELNRRAADLASGSNGSFLVGGMVYTDASATKACIWNDDINDTLQKAGYFITPKLESSEITDTWQSFYLKYRKLLNATDKIVFKYRTVEVDPTEATGTWTAVGASTTTFTTTTDVSAYAIGDEVEVIQGLGSGKCAHITSIVNNAGTYTVILDEVFTSASSGTFKAKFGKWTKLGSISDQVSQFKKFKAPNSGMNDTWIQFKVWMLFTNKNEVHALIAKSDTHQPTN